MQTDSHSSTNSCSTCEVETEYYQFTPNSTGGQLNDTSFGQVRSIDGDEPSTSICSDVVLQNVPNESFYLSREEETRENVAEQSREDEIENENGESSTYSIDYNSDEEETRSAFLDEDSVSFFVDSAANSTKYDDEDCVEDKESCSAFTGNDDTGDVESSQIFEKDITDPHGYNVSSLIHKDTEIPSVGVPDSKSGYFHPSWKIIRLEEAKEPEELHLTLEHEDDEMPSANAALRESFLGRHSRDIGTGEDASSASAKDEEKQFYPRFTRYLSGLRQQSLAQKASSVSEESSASSRNPLLSSNKSILSVDEPRDERYYSQFFVLINNILWCLGVAIVVVLVLILWPQRRVPTKSTGSDISAPVPVPTLAPTSPIVGRGRTLKCFGNRGELLLAIEGYLSQDEDQVFWVNETFGEMRYWCVSRITNFSRLFYSHSTFNEALDGWDLSNAITTREMFRGTAFNQNIEKWNVSSVRDMSAMFQSAISFNQPIEEWDVSLVVDMSYMFSGASSFNQNIGTWNLQSCRNIAGMFAYARSFQGSGISFWNTSLVENMRETFLALPYFDGIGVSHWNVSSCKDMSHMFAGCQLFQADLSAWDVGSCTDMSGTFRGARSFNSDISGWNVSSVIDMSAMFDSALIFNQPIGNWMVHQVTDMSLMFARALSFDQNISSWDVSSVTDMTEMFARTIRFRGYGLSEWDVSSVVSMNGMFLDAKVFNSSKLGTWNVSSLQDMENMFKGAWQFRQDLCSWGPDMQFQPDWSVYRAFDASGCVFTSDPNLTAVPPGPFCFPCDQL